MNIAELIVGLKDAIAKSRGKAELHHGMIAVRNGADPNGTIFPHYSMYYCYIKHHFGLDTTNRDVLDANMRALWGKNYIDFWYTFNHPNCNLTKRQKWIKRIIRQSLGLGPRHRLTSAESVIGL